MKRKNLIRDLIAVWISVTALVCAALNMHVRRNMLGTDRTKEKNPSQPVRVKRGQCSDGFALSSADRKRCIFPVLNRNMGTLL